MFHNSNYKHWQFYVQNPFKNILVKFLHPKVILPRIHLVLSWLSPLSYLTSKGLSKLYLGLIAVLLLPYSANTQALSATTAGAINGNQPYLTFDNGVTKVTTTDDLLGITLSDGTYITPTINTSTGANPIQLTVANQSFADIGMKVPTNTDSIALSTLIGAPYNYWGDDDGDGQGRNGITATGNLSVHITDNTNQTVSRSAILDICQAPYKVELTSTAGSLTTQYGIPNIRSFSGGTATYYINPKAEPKICYARPNLRYGKNSYAGPATIWNPDKGFLVQSTESSSYSRNFPTTGVDGLYFDLLVGGIDAAALTWSTVTQGRITATMFKPSQAHGCDDKGCFNPDGASSVRVTLRGPKAGELQQWETETPGSVARPTLPQTLVLVGKDSSNREVLKYGFVLKQWFVSRGAKEDYIKNHSYWCTYIGYRLTHPKDLTNVDAGEWTIAAPSSASNYQRNIGSGFLPEWGNPFGYSDFIFFDGADYMASDTNGSSPMYEVNPNSGGYGPDLDEWQNKTGVCVYP